MVPVKLKVLDKVELLDKKLQMLNIDSMCFNYDLHAQEKVGNCQ